MATAPLDFELWFSALPFLLAAATLTWLISLPLRTVAIVDSMWSLMLFVAGVIYGLGSDPRAPRLDFALWLLAIWAARLSWHLAGRGFGRVEAHRYRELRARLEPGFAVKSLYRVFWLRAVFAWVVSLPLLGAFASLAPMGWLDYAGIALWLLGFLFEVVGDFQLARFRKDPANVEQVLDHGLWRFTRHPNYFGEFCLWWGFGCIALAAGAWWALAGPALLSFQLLRLSGGLPPAQDIGNRRPRYADYVLKTNAFFPGPPRV
jgi:steroid 5-alpha reductase family enzyme